MAFLHARHGDDPLAGLWEITVRIVWETKKAWLVDDGTRQGWVPKSKIKIVERNKDGTAVVAMPEWLAKEQHFV